MEKWFHCTSHTYGAWLYGDPRGYRTRHHREHVEGDYKHRPPAGMYASQHERSKKLLKQPPVILTSAWRAVVGAALVEKLLTFELQLLVLSMSGQHCHLLAKMPGGPVPREWLGQAKKHSNFIAKESGWTGKLWAVRSKANPIKDRAHQLNTYNYILKHVSEGAWVWDFRAGVTTPESPGTAVPGLSGDDHP
ncbi:hypothetical protein [Limnoglobus roseus]|uniref:Transposase IS200-like domain-containing protein n=1 Tax=Limnoglobus roseus TaxID=2598579 RepID=A0A5C1A882_9BACT|nr:hypothetical protein [Limnoglobus roseus]QEL14705.1 hypothetical protein PX52LOC_01598 [Limnoglobus roseus]